MSAVANALSIDLVVATVDRDAELGRLFDSLDAQTFRNFRVLVADQNEDDRVDLLSEGRTFPVDRVRAPRGLSRARNTALEIVTGDLVAFPDDDCRYPPDLLRSVVELLGVNKTWAGVTGRPVQPDGTRHAGAWDPVGGVIDLRNVWFRGISYTMFLRATLVRRIGEFDDRLGLGSGHPSSSGEETDYLVRAVRSGATIVYVPTIAVEHAAYDYDDATLAAIGLRDGTSLGYILRKHGFPAREIALRLARPAGGSLLSLLRRDLRGARFHAATLRGRVVGYTRRPG
jgi:glycosyltransferase involved in cell wall biosynthesis